MAEKSRESGGRAVGAWVLYLLIAVVAALYLHLRAPGLADPDGFYHFSHARLYATGGPWQADFPWATCSVISQLRSDLWYGYHLLLTPFTLLPPSGPALKAVGVAALVAFLVLLAWAFRLLRAPFPFLWAGLVLVSSPGELWRWLQPRPMVLSTGLAVLLLALLARRRWPAAGFCAFGMVWIHLSAFWAIPMIAGAFALSRVRSEPRAAWLGLASAHAGLLLGWLLRPNPWSAARLLCVQLFDLYGLRHAGVRLLWGTEIGPMDFHALGTDYGPIAALWLAGLLTALYLALRHRLPGEPLEFRGARGAAAILSVASFELTFQLSSRFSDLWIASSVVLLALLVAELLEALAPDTRVRRAAAAIVGVVVALLAGSSVSATGGYLQRLGVVPERLSGPMTWLRRNTPAGSIVFHPQWELFAEMLFWDPDNYYLGGMDPIFQYAADTRKYWMIHRLAIGMDVAHVAAGPPDSEAPGVDTYDALTKEFHASYLLVAKPLNPALYRFAISDPRFHRSYEDAAVAIFRL